MSQSASLVTQKVLNPPELFRESARSDNGIRNLAVRHDEMGVDSLAHVKVNTKTILLVSIVERCVVYPANSPDRNDRRKENQKPEDVDVPLPSETVESNHGE